MSLDRCLVGDIGGTNARFAVAQLLPGGRAELTAPDNFQCADFPSPIEAIDHYLGAHGLARPPAAVIAIAGPVTDGAARLTNNPWSLSEAGLSAAGFAHARLINDYTALAYGAPILGPQDVYVLGPDIGAQDGQTIAVLGAGTGFGVGALAPAGRGKATLVTEGGHIAFAPTDETEVELWRILKARYGRVSVERLLSGQGIVDLHDGLARIAGQSVAPSSASQIVHHALAGTDALCAQVMERFGVIYGAVAGDFALAMGARGGVFIGGGIAPRIKTLLNAGSFRRGFEDKGRFRDYVAAIPTRIMLHPYAALLGAAAAAADLD